MADDIMQQQWCEIMARSQMNEAQIDSATKTLDKARKAMDEFRAERTRVMADSNLSEQGKAIRIAGIDRTAYESISVITQAELSELDKRIGELEYLLRPQNPDSDPVIEEMRQQEVRKLLNGLDELEVMSLYQENAISGDNDLVMRAIEEAPLPLISDAAIIESGKRTRAERQDPKSSILLRQLKQWRSVIEGVLNTARTEIGITDDTLEKMAG